MHLSPSHFTGKSCISLPSKMLLYQAGRPFSPPMYTHNFMTMIRKISDLIEERKSEPVERQVAEQKHHEDKMRLLPFLVNSVNMQYMYVGTWTVALFVLYMEYTKVPFSLMLAAAFLGRALVVNCVRGICVFSLTEQLQLQTSSEHAHLDEGPRAESNTGIAYFFLQIIACLTSIKGHVHARVTTRVQMNRAKHFYLHYCLGAPKDENSTVYKLQVKTYWLMLWHNHYRYDLL